MRIAGYARISVDTESARDNNTSIENQKSIIQDYVLKMFPNDELVFYEDRDRSGYTFEQRESYQKMRRKLLSGEIGVLIVKDFSRFARRNSKGLVELEDLRDAGVRIISIGDSIDYPTHDDWVQIQFRFLINEMPVTDASKKVRDVIKNRQKDGKWIPTVPYGYVMEDGKKQRFSVAPDEAEVVKMIYHLYSDEGWGYKKIANHLTEIGILTPRMKEKIRVQERGDTYSRKFNSTWSFVTVQEILSNDFYAGTLRQRKYSTKTIHGKPQKLAEDENIVFENHHEAIIPMKDWLRTQSLKKQRTTSHYRGIKKYPNVYSGLLVCGDCGSPMFSMSRSDMAPAYICGRYHKHGLKGCTSHHIRVDALDFFVKQYITMLKEISKDIIEQIEKNVKQESRRLEESENSLAYISQKLEEANEELIIADMQRIKMITNLEREGKSENEIERERRAHKRIEDEILQRISSLEEQRAELVNRKNEIYRINRVGRTMIDVLDDIIEKESLSKTDLQFVIEKITVYDKEIKVQLKQDIFELLQLQREESDEVNFQQDSKVILTRGLIIEGKFSPNTASLVRMITNKHLERLFTVNVISSSDPIEIFTDKEGQVILQKYSPLGDLMEVAENFADALASVCGHMVLIADRDVYIAAAGGARAYLGKPIGKAAEEKIHARESIISSEGERNFVNVCEEVQEDIRHEAIMPIICQGDIVGGVVFLEKDPKKRMTEADSKLLQAAVTFLGKQIEH